MPTFFLSLPADFSDYEWEVTAKGWFSEARLVVSGKSYCLTFYDPARLGQDIKDELESAGVFFGSNLVIVRSVTRVNMERAAEWLIQSGQTSLLMPE